MTCRSSRQSDAAVIHVPQEVWIRRAREERRLDHGIADALRESLNIRGMAIKLAPLSRAENPAAPEPKRGGGSLFPLRFVQLPCDVEGAA